MTMIITNKDRDENGKMTDDNDNDNHTHTEDNPQQKRHSNKTKIETRTLSTAKPRHTRNIVPFSHESIGCKCRKSSKLDKKESLLLRRGASTEELGINPAHTEERLTTDIKSIAKLSMKTE